MTGATGELGAFDAAPLSDLGELVRDRRPSHLLDEAVVTAVAKAREAEISWGAIATVLRGTE